jgi:hypothetical protein
MTDVAGVDDDGVPDERLQNNVPELPPNFNRRKHYLFSAKPRDKGECSLMSYLDPFEESGAAAQD